MWVEIKPNGTCGISDFHLVVNQYRGHPLGRSLINLRRRTLIPSSSFMNQAVIYGVIDSYHAQGPSIAEIEGRLNVPNINYQTGYIITELNHVVNNTLCNVYNASILNMIKDQLNNQTNAHTLERYLSQVNQL